MVILRGMWSLFVTAVIFVGVIIGSLLGDALEPRLLGESPEMSHTLFGLGLSAAGGLFGFLFAVFFFRKLVSWISYFERVSLLDKIAAALGTVIGLALAILVTFPFMRHLGGYGLPITIFASVAGIVLGVGFAMSAKEQIAYIFPTLSRAPSGGMRMPLPGAVPKMMDTNIIIDGRICTVVGTGFIEGPLYVPDFILGELHHIADSEDNLKRARGRRGLDILNQLKSMENIEVEIFDDYTDKEAPYDEVDTRLVRLAKAKSAKVLTNDFGVGEIARLHGVSVLNVNELATALKPVYLPGEQFTVSLIKQGKESDQAVGYLEDGTMVVVKRAAHLVGKNLAVEVETVLQTTAGKMIFAVLSEDAEQAQPNSKE